MAIAFRGAWNSTHSYSTLTSGINVNKPAGVLDGDVLMTVMFAAYSGTSPRITVPAGWTVRARVQDTNIDWLVATKVASAEPSTWLFSVPGLGAFTGAACVSYSGASGLDVAGSSGYTPASNSPVAPSLTAVNAAPLLVAIFNTPTQSRTATPPSGMTERVDTGDSLSKGFSSISVHDQQLSASGATGDRTATLSGTGDTLSVLLTLAPAADPPAETVRHRASSILSAYGVPGYYTDYTIDKPTGVAPGDILLLGATMWGGGPTYDFVAPAGFTLLDTVQIATYMRASVWWKVAAGEPADYTLLFSGGSSFLHVAAGIAAFYGGNVISAHAASSGSHVAPSITTVDADCTLVTLHANSIRTTFTPPAGMTEVWENSCLTDPSYATVEMAYQYLGAAGATGTRTATPGASSNGINFSLAIANRNTRKRGQIFMAGF